MSWKKKKPPQNFKVDDYNSLPPKRVFSIFVKYKFVGRGKPMPYRIDDGT